MADRESYTDDQIVSILAGTRVMAMVGASPNWIRPSYFAMKYVQGKGIRVVPVNPHAAGREILGEQVYQRLADIPFDFQMVDVFRNSDAVPGILAEALAIKQQRGIRYFWLQLGVYHEPAAKAARAEGLTVVMDRCVKIEYGRLCGELAWGGVNSGIISSRRRRMLS